jgi:parallel beta-helix repeat protein
MLDPGSPTSRFPQEASFDNLFEYNEAWGNDGYGMRVVGSRANTLQMNTFSGNLQGITVEQGSTDNIIKNNTITGSGLYGIFVTGGSDRTTISGNTVRESGKHGIYIKTGNNTISQNTVSQNGSVLNGVATGSGIATLQESTPEAAAADLTLPGALASIAAAAPELLAVPTAITPVEGNVITENTVENNSDEGIELKSATGTLVEGNVVRNNGANGIYLASAANSNTLKKNTITNNLGHGIRANGVDAVANTWTENLVYENGAGGIATTSSANNGIKAPKLTRTGDEVTGTSMPGATVELFSDIGGQGRYFETRVQVGSDGTFSVTRAWLGANVNATVTDGSGNTSAFTYNVGHAVLRNTIYLPVATR